MDISNKKVHFLGDSITEGCGASAPDKCFVALFQQKYPEAEITNYGIGGTRIARQMKHSENIMHDYDFNQRVRELKSGADLVVVFGGTNDYGHGDAPFGEWGDKTEKTFCGAVYALYEKLLNKFRFAQILVLTPLRRVNEENPSLCGRPLIDYVEIIRKTAEYFALPVLDLYKTSGMNPAVAKVQETMMPDGLHPNDTGYQRLFSLIDGYIATL